MNRLLTLTTATAALTASHLVAIADGMPAEPPRVARGVVMRSSTPPPTTRCSAALWRGFYGGLQVGASGFGSDIKVLNGNNSVSQSDSDTGVTFGGQVGYNFARCNSIIGVEADFVWADQKSTWGVSGPAAFTGANQLNWLGTARLRAGFTVDQMLLYMTGGIALADIDHLGRTTTTTPVLNVSTNESKLGWVIGAGIEYLISERISLKGEGLYTRLEADDFKFNLASLTPQQPMAIRSQDDIWSLRVGMNFKFGDRAIDYSSSYK